jgi:predicted DNA-binding transcriptional regulator YafY
MAFFLTAKKPVALEGVAKIEGYRGKTHDALRQAFYRDRRELARFGVEIECLKDPETQKDVYYIPPEKRYLPQINFTSEEVWSLTLLNQFLSKLDDYPFRTELNWALRKLLFDVEDEALSNAGMETSFLLDVTPRSARVSKHLEVLDEAVRNRKRVRFFYYSVRSGKTSLREIDPYYLFQQRGSWYVVGFCHFHRELRTYKVGRIKGEIELSGAKDSGPDFTVSKEFDPNAFKDLRPWMREEEKIEVEVAFSPKVYFWVRKSVKFESSRELSDGRTALKMKVGHLSSFLDWLFSFGRDAELLSPRYLREEIRRILIQLKEQV